MGMKRLVTVVVMVALSLFVLTLLPMAQQHGHSQEAQKGEAMKMETKDVSVEGVRVSFQIMANAEHKKMLADMSMKADPEAGTTHNITLTLKDENTQKEITSAEVTMKVVDPKGKSQVKKLKFEEMMKSYDAYFNMPEKGKYQVMALIKIGNKKRPAGIYYEVN
jgi:hypothetical protein